MKRIGDQVHGDLMYLRGICGDHAAIRVDMAFNFNISGYCCLGQFQCLFQDRLNPDGQFLGVSLTAESQDLFDQITAAIGQCQNILLDNIPHIPVPVEMEGDESGEPEIVSDDAGIPGVSVPAQHKGYLPHTHPCVLVRALEDMDSFMGVDGRIYTLSKGDIVTLPERNAAVLSERNIVLNINLCK